MYCIRFSSNLIISLARLLQVILQSTISNHYHTQPPQLLKHLYTCIINEL